MELHTHFGFLREINENKLVVRLCKNISSYFPSKGLHKKFPRTIPFGRKVCVGGGGLVALKVTLVLALVQNQGLGFGFGPS